MATTNRYAMTLLAANQSSPEIVVNEALKLLDLLVNLNVLDETTTPPGSPTEGGTYWIAGAGTGAWSGHTDKIAWYTGGAWRFITLPEGSAMWIADTDTLKVWNGTTLITV